MEELKLTFVNVGYGEAMVLECPDPGRPDGTFVMVIDGGSGEAEEYAGESGRIPLDTYLSLRGICRIDLMVATHIHEDHLCGLLPVAERLTPGAFWQTLPPDFFRAMRPLAIPEGANPSRRKFISALNDYRLLCHSLAERGRVPLTLAASGETIPLCQGLTVRVLAPSSDRAGQLEHLCRALYQEVDEAAFWQQLDRLDAAMNNFSLILLLEYGDTRILLPGDTNCMGYSGLTAEDLRADLFKVGHHGQRDGVSPEQIHAIAPQAVACCASSDRRYNSAEPGILRMMADTGAVLYFSDCPPGPDGTPPPPHQALTFTIGPNGTVHGAYLSLSIN